MGKSNSARSGGSEAFAGQAASLPVRQDHVHRLGGLSKAGEGAVGWCCPWAVAPWRCLHLSRQPLASSHLPKQLDKLFREPQQHTALYPSKHISTHPSLLYKVLPYTSQPIQWRTRYVTLYLRSSPPLLAGGMPLWLNPRAQ